MIMYRVEPVYSGYHETSLKCPDYEGVLIFQVSLHVNRYFGFITKCPDFGGVLFSSALINQFHCNLIKNFPGS